MMCYACLINLSRVSIERHFPKPRSLKRSQTLPIAVKFAEMLTKLDGRSGNKLEKPKFLKSGDADG